MLFLAVPDMVSPKKEPLWQCALSRLVSEAPEVENSQRQKEAVDLLPPVALASQREAAPCSMSGRARQQLLRVRVAWERWENSTLVSHTEEANTAVSFPADKFAVHAVEQEQLVCH